MELNKLKNKQTNKKKTMNLGFWNISYGQVCNYFLKKNPAATFYKSIF